jgi:hypothetical protein
MKKKKEQKETLFGYIYKTGNGDWGWYVTDKPISRDDIQAILSVDEGLFDQDKDTEVSEYEEISEFWGCDLGDGDKWIYGVMTESSDYYFDVGQKSYKNGKALGKHMGLGEEANYIAETHQYPLYEIQVTHVDDYKRAIEAFHHYWNDPDPEAEVSDA